MGRWVAFQYHSSGLFFFLPKNAAKIPYRLAGIRADTISLYDPSHYIYNSRIRNTEIKQFLRPPKPCPAQGMVGLMFSIKKASQFGPILSSARSTARCRQGRGPRGALLTAMSHPCGCCVPGTGWSGSRTAELLAGVGGWKPQSASPHFPLHCSSCQFNSPPTKWHQCTANHNENICTDGLQINAPHLLSPALRAGITCMGTAVLQPEPCASPSPSSNPALGTGPAPHTPSNCDNRRAAQLAREGGGGKANRHSLHPTPALDDTGTAAGTRGRASCCTLSPLYISESSSLLQPGNGHANDNTHLCFITSFCSCITARKD